MKKYKLIKEYPGSPILNTIIEYIEESDDIDEPFNGWIDNNDNEYESPENYPEFWQEIIEKDYEILMLSLQGSERHRLTNVINNSNDYIEALLNCHGNYIHSVKRLSDGEI